jgi:RNA polymerase sigma-70 factor, ECF subfamily
MLTADEPTSRAEDVSFALLVVLERLSPLERVVFVLRTTFEFEFGEIAAVVGRDASACRKILSRARARVIEGRPRFAVDRDRHMALIRSFRDAVRARDTDGLIALLDDKVVVRGDGGGKALTAKKPIHGSAAAARFLIAVARTQSPATAVDEIELNGAPALVMTEAGRLVATILIDTDGERIHSIFGVANPDKLAAVARVMGGAVSRESQEAADFASA